MFYKKKLSGGTGDPAAHGMNTMNKFKYYVNIFLHKSYIKNSYELTITFELPELSTGWHCQRDFERLNALSLWHRSLQFFV